MFKQSISPLAKGDVRLRLLERADLERTLAWRNQNRKWFIASDLLSMDRHLVWFEHYLTRNDDYVFIIECFSFSQEPVGQISLYKIDSNKKEAEFGRLLIGEPNARRMGIATTATEILLHYAIGELALKTIKLEVLENNIPAISLYSKCGFVQKSVRNGRILMVKSITRNAA